MNTVLGTMNFGPQLNLEQSRTMVKEFLATGFSELDTAYVYNGGATEEYLGEILPEIPESGYKIATKIHPRITGALDRNAILSQLKESMRRMNLTSVDLLYFHFPDKKTPIDEALQTVAELCDKGIVGALGLSNYPAWEVANIIYLCDRYACPRPVVYQGMYNALCRNVESELFDCIRHYGICFYAFNPLAGGMLTGKHRNIEEKLEGSGRFARLESYRERYWKKSYFDALDIVCNECEKEGIAPVEAAYRWLVNHSRMNASCDDAILLGASKLSQMGQNMDAIKKGPLPQTILDAYETAWDEAKRDSPSYFKYF
jgi:aflatoxin B1 aldehyde reductase